MGRLIDADILIAELKESAFHHCNNSREDSLLQRDRVIVRAQPTVEAIPKADYETRLKADLLAVLTNMSMKIGEIEDGYTEFDEESKRSLTMIPLESVERLIDGEINSLKEDTNQ